MNLPLSRGLHLNMARLGREAADKAARDEAARVVERWNQAIIAGREMWWSPTIRAAIVAGMPWADVHCPGCRTSRSLDLRTIDRHPLASVGSLVLGLRVVRRRGAHAENHRAACHATMPRAGELSAGNR